MGRSSSSPSSWWCLKIIACGSNTTAEDDHHHTPPQTKASGDKRGWSFRKRSGRHRVLGNNSSSETATFTDKEIPQVSNTDLRAAVKSTAIEEKPEVPKTVEKFSEVSAFEYDGEPKPSMEGGPSENDSSTARQIPKVSQVMVASDNDSDSTSSEAKMADGVSVSRIVCAEPSANPDTATESVVLEVESNKMAESRASDSEAESEEGSDASFIVDEAVVITIQTAVRGFLARKRLEQLQSTVKLQAVIRGHLVRRNAVETLHCIRGIAKVQALVRARSSKSLEQNYKSSGEQFSIAKLLKNSFARQLLESTPKSKYVKIRCDPLSPNPTWGWLEKWMSVTTCEVLENVDSSTELQNDDQVLTNNVEVEADMSPTVLSEPYNLRFAAEERTNLIDSEGNNFNQVTDTVDLQSSLPMCVEQQQAHTHISELINEDVDSVKKHAHASQADLQAESIPLPDKTAAEIQQPKLSSKHLASEELNGEGKKTSYGSRKPSNPDLIATQSKFEELTSAVNSGKSISSSHQIGAETNVDASSTLVEVVDRASDVLAAVPSDPHILVAGSECGTELSVSSTLDSPDRCESESALLEPKTEAVEASPDIEGEVGPGYETSGVSSNHILDLPSQTAREEEVHAVNSITFSPVVAEVSTQVEQKAVINEFVTEIDFAHVSSVIDENSSPMVQKHDLSEHDTSIEPDSAAHQTDKLSSAASPNSHMTLSESQGTPSSQVSVKSKKKVNRSGSNAKHSSIPAGKRSPNLNFDLGVRISAEQLPKDHKTGKRRNSFGSTKSNNTDQEPRDSNSDGSMPSYMQATKSARMKAHSPRSSPDVRDKEVSSKKRHSLPSAGGRQGSPCVQRSTSQAVEGAKANGSDPSNERKWQR